MDVLLALQAAAEQSSAVADVAPYVGGGGGLGLLVYVTHRISVAVDRVSRTISDRLGNWDAHQKAQQEHWQVEEALLRELREDAERRDRQAAAAREYVREAAEGRRALDLLRGDVAELRDWRREVSADRDTQPIELRG